jgi:hypothetical protein
VSGRLWPIAEAARADYERLREATLAGEAVEELLAARRFARRGLAALIRSPGAEAAYLGSIVGAQRPPWSGAEDPRDARLRDAYGFLLGRAASGQGLRAVGR